MTPYFTTKERQKLLLQQIEQWTGTPWFPNGRSRCGISCQTLAPAVYRDCGMTIPEVPDGDMIAWKFAQGGPSTIEEFIANLPNFTPIKITEILPGDLLGFQLGRIVHHLGIYAGDGEFLHVLVNSHSSLASIHDATWMTRLVRAWRPIEL